MFVKIMICCYMYIKLIGRRNVVNRYILIKLVELNWKEELFLWFNLSYIYIIVYSECRYKDKRFYWEKKWLRENIF